MNTFRLQNFFIWIYIMTIFFNQSYSILSKLLYTHCVNIFPHEFSPHAEANVAFFIIISSFLAGNITTYDGGGGLCPPLFEQKPSKAMAS